MKKKEICLRVLFVSLTLLVMLSIFLFSNDPASSSSKMSGHFSGFVQRVFFPHWPNLEPELFQQKTAGLSFLIRKCAHFLMFMLLGSSASLAFFSFRFRPHFSALSAFVFSALYAVTDEVHQTFVPGRSGEVFDFFVDSAGAFFGAFLAMGVLAMILLERERKKQENALTETDSFG